MYEPTPNVCKVDSHSHGRVLASPITEHLGSIGGAILSSQQSGLVGAARMRVLYSDGCH